MSNMIRVQFDDSRSIEVPYKTHAIEAVKMVEENINDILALKINNEIKSCDYELVKDSTIEYVTFKSNDGYRIYSRTLKLILHMALTTLFSNTKVEFISTINRDQYFIVDNIALNSEKVKAIKEKMQEIIDRKLPISKKIVSLEEATELYKASNDTQKLKNIGNRLKSYLSMYFCDGMYNSFYGVLAPNTSCIFSFDLIQYKEGALLVIPDENMNIKKDITDNRLYDAFINFNNLNEILGINDIGDLNDVILKNRINDTIQVSEAIHQRNLVELVLDIEKRKNVKMILIAGPSSSRKNYFCSKTGDTIKTYRI